MDFTEANRLLSWMRLNGVVSARMGDVSLVLGDAVDNTPVPERIGTRPKKPLRPEEDPDLFGGSIPGFLPRDEGDE